jgi:4-diphosphocytidyl-2-C-methyl-D-erythritol kinase
MSPSLVAPSREVREYRTHASGRFCRMNVRAHAKLNVTLEVLGRRGDGYHEVVHVMQLLELHDTISLAAREDGAIRLSCTSSEIDREDNLAVAAAALLKERFDVAAGIEIELDKRIPIAGGLGGGSSDAAAVLVAASRLWGLTPSPDELVEIAATLGSDVPFFLHGGLALCEGRGERVTPLSPSWPASMRWLLLVKPAIGVPTGDAYHGLPRDRFTDGAHSRSIGRRLAEGKGFELEDVKNGIAASVFERYPDVARARDALLAAGAPRAELCGTGATVFAPFDDLESARRVEAALDLAEATTIVTEPRRGDA